MKFHRSFKRATGVAEDWPLIYFFVSHAGPSGDTGPSPDNLYLTVIAQICPGSSPGPPPAPPALWAHAQPSK